MKHHSTNINDRSSDCGPNFRKVIKMAKWWNHQHSSLMQSYHLEVIALNAFNSAMTDITWDVFAFFDKAFEVLK